MCISAFSLSFYTSKAMWPTPITLCLAFDALMTRQSGLVALLFLLWGFIAVDGGRRVLVVGIWKVVASRMP